MPVKPYPVTPHWHRKILRKRQPMGGKWYKESYEVPLTGTYNATYAKAKLEHLLIPHKELWTTLPEYIAEVDVDTVPDDPTLIFVTITRKYAKIPKRSVV